MQSLKKRVSSLEKNVRPTEKITQIRRIVWIGQTEVETRQIRDEKGTLWVKLPGEQESDFVSRAKSEAWRNEFGVMALNGFVWL